MVFYLFINLMEIVVFGCFFAEFEPSMVLIATVMIGVVVLLSQNGVDKPGIIDQ